MGKHAQTPSRRPSTPEQRTPGAAASQPEEVRLMVGLWSITALLELVHLLTGAVMSWFNKDALVAMARESIQDMDTLPQDSDALVNLAANAALIGSSVLSLLLWLLLVFLLYVLSSKGSWAGGARRVWFAFSLYFAFRLMMVFAVTPAGSKAPEWLFVTDGALQILAGCAAVMGLLLSMKDPVLDYTGEMEQFKKLEEERRKLDAERKELKAQREQEREAKRQAKLAAKDTAAQHAQSGQRAPGPQGPQHAQPPAEEEKK